VIFVSIVQNESSLCMRAWNVLNLIDVILLQQLSFFHERAVGLVMYLHPGML